MRSRYTAFVRGDAAFLLRTWHPSTRPAALDGADTLWRGLEVVRAERGLSTDDEGVVAFVAHFEDDDGGAGALRETSRFVREEGEWLYVDGDVT